VDSVIILIAASIRTNHLTDPICRFSERSMAWRVPRPRERHRLQTE
jgi:hypothetical protein